MTGSRMNVTEWKQAAIDHFRDGKATDQEWAELAECLLWHSEHEGLEILDPVIDPEAFAAESQPENT